MRKTFALGGNSPAKLDASTGLPEKPAQLGLALRALSNATARDAWRAWVEASLIYWRLPGGGRTRAIRIKAERRAEKRRGWARNERNSCIAVLRPSRRALQALLRMKVSL